MGFKKILPRYNKCFVCGKLNPSGIKTFFTTDGKVVETKVNLGEEFVGYENCIHGGIVSALLDETMGWACIDNGKKFYYTIELTIKYIKPVLPNVDLTVTAKVIGAKGKILEAQGELIDYNGVVCATASGLFYPAKDIDTEGIMQYLVHEPEDGRDVTVDDL